jgi:hypothetical protein
MHFQLSWRRSAVSPRYSHPSVTPSIFHPLNASHHVLRASFSPFAAFPYSSHPSDQSSSSKARKQTPREDKGKQGLTIQRRLKIVANVHSGRVEMIPSGAMSEHPLKFTAGNIRTLRWQQA